MAVKSQTYKSVRDALSSKDFHWPWFDQCAEQLRELGGWPDAKAWELFASEPELLRSKAQVLAKIPGGELKVIARQNAVTIPSKAKVAEIRAILDKALNFEQLAQNADELNLKITEKHTKKRLDGKYDLLERSVLSRALNQYRYFQIRDMSDRGYRPAIEWCDEISKKMASFGDGKVPPFYPGDWSSVESIPPKGSLLESLLSNSVKRSEWTTI